MKNKRVLLRFAAVNTIVEIILESSDWGDQMSVIAALGHIYCGRHTMWKLPNDHPTSPEPSPSELALRKDMFEQVSELLDAMIKRDRGDVLEAAGDILFDSEWSTEDYDEKQHTDTYVGSPEAAQE